jgi:hypothetical protein
MMITNYRIALTLLLAGLCACSALQAADQKVFFVEPKDGASVGQEVKVVMGVEGMEVKPLGEMAPNTGHHHLLVDAEDVPAGTVVPVNQPPKYLHFGKGQTETTIQLTPGQHKLTLQFADGAHISYGEKMRASITVNVK